MTSAIIVDHVSKKFRLYHEKNQYLKSTLLHGRRARFEEFWAVKDVSFEIPEGSTFGIIGANGSGKSTLLKCLAGILTPDEGTLKVSGRLSALLELGAGFHPELSGRENIQLNGAILGMTSNEIEQRFDDIVEFAGLGAFIDTPVKNYSSGMVVRLGFAIAANVEPNILIIDEVLAVGDASFQQRCFEKIEKFRQDGRTIVLVSHGLSEVEQLCNTVAWIEKGSLRAIGDGYKIVSEYQGVSHNAKARVEGEIGERWGSGEADITSVELLDRDLNSKTVFATGRPMTIRVHFDAHVPISDPVVGIRITHLHGANIWGTNTKRRAFALPRIHGTGSVDLQISNLPLLEGTYDLTIALSDHAEVHPFDHWEKRVRFDVHQYDTFDEGIVSIESSWSV
jgi:ABC-type polysaccharide/polyol phosphate transport system ATPase subunit